jgi:predicted RNA-binding protein YlqC (UPF0109 family)
VRHHPYGRSVDTAADVEPLDDDRSVELRGFRGFQDDDADGVIGRTGRLCLPIPVGAQVADGCVGRCRSGDEELVVGVAEVGKVIGTQK